jgi:hypothetical protein
MTDIITEVKDEAVILYDDVKTALEPAAKTVETDVEEAGAATLNYIKTNGLQDVYQIALTIIGAMIPGASWTAALASIEAQALAAGKQLVSGSSAIVASMAQSDLIAAGKLLPPVTTSTSTAAS